MEDYPSTYSAILKEVTEHSVDTHNCFLQKFGIEVAEFSGYMTRALLNWRDLKNEIMKEHEQGLPNSVNKAHVVLLAYSALTSHIMGLKVFLLGLLIPAGNIMRQVIELIALSILCSNKDESVLDRFLSEKYSTQKAVQDVVKCAKKVGLTKEGIDALKRSQRFYSKYSHPTMLTLADHFSFEKPEEGLNFGACFDEGKRDKYSKELMGRISLAKQFSAFIDGIRLNLKGW